MIRSDIEGQAWGYAAVPFVGRTTELAEITERLHNAECRLLTLTGLGGSGKTRLAIEAARSAAPHFTQGTVFAALQALTRSDLLVPTIAQAVGLSFYGEADLRQQLIDYLRDKNLLLILDNFEHLLDGAILINDLLASAPGIKILVTSREALNLREEWLYPLRGLSTPHSVYSTALEDYEAAQLFLFHARRVQPGFDALLEHESIIRICQMTAGLPLAIELAASWLKGLSAVQVAAEIQHNLDFLSTSARNIEERHRSMRAVFDQSWNLLSDSERRIFARLSVFRGSFDSAAASEVAEAAFTDLAGLVEKSLVQMVSAGRFGIHEMLRQYGMERLAADDTEASYARHSRYYAQRMLEHESGLQQSEQLNIMQVIDQDFENFRQAWDWSVRQQQLANLHAMLNGLYLYGYLGNRHREIMGLFQDSLDQALPDEALRGRLLARRWGYLHWWYLTDYQETIRDIEHALTIAAAQDDPFEIAFCHLMMAYTMISTERRASALPHLETSLKLFEALDKPYYICWVLHRIGFIYYDLDDNDQSMAYTQRSLALAQDRHDRGALVICLYNLGSDYILNRDYMKGKLYSEQALAIATESGHQIQLAHALSLSALYAFSQGDFAACQDYAERARAIIEAINLLIFQPYSFCLQILLACLREDYAEGIRLNAQGKRHGTSKIDLQLHSWVRAVLACGAGSRAEVRENIQSALEGLDSSVTPLISMWIIPCATYALAETDPVKAVELLGWLRTCGESALNWVCQWPLFDRLEAQLQAAMPAEVFEDHWAAGNAQSLKSVSAYIQRAFGQASDFSGGENAQLLTEREQEILGLIAAGMTNPQIAAQLVIGAGTVKTHTLSIYRKLDVANRTQAIRRAQELGLLPG